MRMISDGMPEVEEAAAGRRAGSWRCPVRLPLKRHTLVAGLCFVVISSIIYLNSSRFGTLSPMLRIRWPGAEPFASAQGIKIDNCSLPLNSKQWRELCGETALTDNSSRNSFPGSFNDNVTSPVVLNNATLVASASAAHIVLYWTTVYGHKSFYLGFGQAPFSGCRYNNCVATADKSQLYQAEAVLFHGRSIDLSSLPHSRSSSQLFVFACRESPSNTPAEVISTLGHYFNLSMTYRENASVCNPYSMVMKNRSQKGLVPNFSERRPAPAWLVSHCSTQSGRERYVHQLRQHLEVDQYGHCGSQSAPAACKNGILACYRRLAQSHLFYLSFENSLCNDYITEKFWLALQVGMVPVAMGATLQQYQRVAPPRSFIHVDQFASVAELAQYLLSLSKNRTAYEEYLAWRERYSISGGHPACELCERLHQGGPAQQLNLQEEWETTRQCRSGYTDS